MCTCFHLEEENGASRRLAAAAQASRLAGRFAAAGKKLRLAGEIRPTDVVPVAAPGQDGGRGAFPMQWGFRMPGGALVVNARTETAAGKPSFRDSWARRRCAIPASRYFEWEHSSGPGGRRTVGAKYAIRPAGAAMFWLCGLYRMEDGLPVFAVLTRAAVPALAWLHDRMPLILPGERIGDWLHPSTRPEDLLEFTLTDMVAEKAEAR
jgi:putative SOS response-associated peptidase YedK